MVRGRRATLAGVVVVAAAGCGGSPPDGPASSPGAAVSAFLAPLEDLASRGGRFGPEEGRRRAARKWRKVCARVDPSIRRGLRFEEEAQRYSTAECGGVALLLAAYTGDTNRMVHPTGLTGTPRDGTAAAGDDTAFVTVDMRYRAEPSPPTPSPPARAAVKVLVVRRDGAWYVATPQAVNPLEAVEGGFSERELRKQHADLLAAARG